MNCALCLDPDSNHTTEQHEHAARVVCRECHEVEVKDEDDTCPECLSELASYYVPDEGGSN